MTTASTRADAFLTPKRDEKIVCRIVDTPFGAAVTMLPMAKDAGGEWVASGQDVEFDAAGLGAVIDALTSLVPGRDLCDFRDRDRECPYGVKVCGRPKGHDGGHGEWEYV